MQLEHGISQEDTADMVKSFISRLLPDPLRAILTTLDGHLIDTQPSFGRCHYPGCSYVSGIGARIDVHIGRKHREMQTDIRTLG
jgi:hypothetical protein